MNRLIISSGVRVLFLFSGSFTNRNFLRSTIYFIRHVFISPYFNGANNRYRPSRILFKVSIHIMRLTCIIQSGSMSACFPLQLITIKNRPTRFIMFIGRRRVIVNQEIMKRTCIFKVRRLLFIRIVSHRRSIVSTWNLFSLNYVVRYSSIQGRRERILYIVFIRSFGLLYYDPFFICRVANMRFRSLIFVKLQRVGFIPRLK